MSVGTVDLLRGVVSSTVSMIDVDGEEAPCPVRLSILPEITNFCKRFDLALRQSPMRTAAGMDSEFLEVWSHLSQGRRRGGRGGSRRTDE